MAEKRDSQPVEFRPATAADAGPLAEAAADLFLQAYRGQMAEQVLADYVAANFSPEIQLAELANPAVATTVAIHRKKIIGYVQLWSGVEPPAGATADLELRRIYLDRAWHGRGLGRMLLAEAADAARTIGAEAVWLGVFAENDKAIAFYLRNGFAQVGTTTFRMGPEVQQDLVLEAPVAALPQRAEGGPPEGN